MKIPQGALPDDVEGDVEVEVKNVDVGSVPDALADTVFVRAIELNTLIDGEISPVDYRESVELTFVLTQEDLDLVEGDTTRLGLVWFNEETDDWESIATAYEDDPPPVGRLVAFLDHFSLYALGVMEAGLPEEQQVTETETATPIPAPTVEPTATSVPLPVPSPLAGVVATSTPVPATPTAIAMVQAAPTPVPTAVPQPTATVAPPAPALPAAPAPPSQPPVEPEAPPILEETGGIGTATLVILIVVGIAVLAGVAVVGQGLWSRRRQA